MWKECYPHTLKYIRKCSLIEFLIHLYFGHLMIDIYLNSRSIPGCKRIHSSGSKQAKILRDTSQQILPSAQPAGGHAPGSLASVTFNVG